MGMLRGHRDRMEEGKGEVRLCGVHPTLEGEPGAELDASYTLSSHPPAVLLREGFVYWWSICLPAPVCRCTGPCASWK